MTELIIRHDLMRILEEVYLEDEDIIREGYSGRGMFGRTCFAMMLDEGELDDMDDAAEELLLNGDIESNPIPALRVNARMDEMGLKKITYFPGYELTR